LKPTALRLVVSGLAPLAIAALALTALVGCDRRHSAGGGGGTGPPPVNALMLQPVASGLDKPVLVLSAPADTSRLFVLEQSGRIRIVRGGSVLTTPFLDLHTLVSTDFEQGLLGMAFDPDYATSGRFLVSYTDVKKARPPVGRAPG